MAMTQLSSFQGKSQFDNDIQTQFRPSACGPVTASVILRYLDAPLSEVPINTLYKMLGTTRIGLFTWRFVYRLNKMLEPNWYVEKCLLPDVLAELDSGRPVAVKFDKWFSLKWFGHYDFDYHWVPIIGYEQVGTDVFLVIHDNGSPSANSSVRTVSYRKNRDILTFVKFVAIHK